MGVTLSPREEEIVSLTAGIIEFSEKVESAYEYLSREMDAWGSSYNIGGAVKRLEQGMTTTDRKSFPTRKAKAAHDKVMMSELFASEIISMRGMCNRAEELGLLESVILGERIRETRKTIEKILSGDLVRPSFILESMSGRH